MRLLVAVMFLFLGVAQAPAQRVIRTLSALKAMRNSMASGPVDVTAQVTIFDLTQGLLILQDGLSGVYANVQISPDRPLRAGDWVRVRGVAMPGGFAPIIRVSSLEWQRSGQLPSPRRFSPSDAMSADLENLWGTIDATVVQIRDLHSEPEPALILELQDETGLRFYAFWFGGRLAEAVDLARARVEITAVIGTEGNGFGQKIRPLVFMQNRSQIRILSRSPVEWDAPKVNADEILTYGSTLKLGSRVRIAGMITYGSVNGDKFYLDDGTGGVVIWPILPSSLHVGMSIEVTGVVDRQDDQFGIAQAAHRAAAPRSTNPIRLTPDNTTTTWYGGRLIEALIRVRQVTQAKQYTTIYGEMAGQEVNVQSMQPLARPLIQGDLISVRGVAEFESVPDAFLQLTTILTRYPTDIRIVAPAPWWSRVPWGLIAAAAFLLLLVSLIRNALMRREMILIMSERKRIARELHDTLLQGFSGLLFHLQAVSTNIPLTSQNVRDDLSHVLTRMETYLEDARQAVTDLRREQQGTDAVSLPERLRYMVQEQTKDSGVDFRCGVEGLPRSLSKTMEAQIYRVATEAVINALRHSKCRQIRLKLDYRERDVQLLVSDDGIGFDPGLLAADQREHFGLRGMRERVASLKGELQIETAPNKGCAILANFPG